ncbi:hypothetical protein [Stigmatella aurantiaca]|uniref:Conserved uncharacterized protein n=1 Tax=Stigmatella aurantiaca (strain DW4/3-1) TaxID=378806 RepID=Q08SH2_STIAD|nr:hypothetical protein [Stigmatella aurantiaca]ADO71152.1 conserved uncharacterized protein [Stigmatella aurantiaca DW4/3-1]EAU63433.1 hypothetical protein STIAU_4725 [Stigmatella aurantiaca DW4/3-1]
MSEEQLVQEERQRRIAELEARLARRPRSAIRPPMALLAIGVSVALLAMQGRDLAYLFSPRTPLSLGAEGDYRPEALLSNRYAQLHGVPAAHGAYEREGDALYVLVGLRESPFVVRRPALPGEEWIPGRPPPPPDPRPFAVRGRLLAEEDAPRYRDAFALLREKGELQPREGRLWLLIEGQRPGEDWGRAGVAVLLAAFAAANGVLLVRGLRRPPAGER